MNNSLALYVITDSGASGGLTHQEACALALEGGADVIQLRDKNMSARDLVETGKKLLALTEKKEALLIVNDRVDVAAAIGAPGVHLGQEDLALPLARKIVGEKTIIGVSVDNVSEALEAQKQGADYLGVGAIFSSPTKGSAPVIGLDMLKEIAFQVTIPIVAIGGINLDNIQEVMRAGANGAAVISAIVGAPDITAAARTFKKMINSLL